MMYVHHKIGYHHMMSAHYFKSESESRLFKRPFSFLSSQRYNEARSEPLHSCDENGECHLHDHLAPEDWHPAQDDQLQGVLQATWPLLDQQQLPLFRVQHQQDQNCDPQQQNFIKLEH